MDVKPDKATMRSHQHAGVNAFSRPGWTSCKRMKITSDGLLAVKVR